MQLYGTLHKQTIITWRLSLQVSFNIKVINKHAIHTKRETYRVLSSILYKNKNIYLHKKQQITTSLINKPTFCTTLGGNVLGFTNSTGSCTSCIPPYSLNRPHGSRGCFSKVDLYFSNLKWSKHWNKNYKLLF